MISFPKEVSYVQLKKLIKLIMKNFTKNSLANSKKFPYILKICETNKNKCLFCSTV